MHQTTHRLRQGRANMSQVPEKGNRMLRTREVSVLLGQLDTGIIAGRSSPRDPTRAIPKAAARLRREASASQYSLEIRAAVKKDKTEKIYTRCRDDC